MKNPIRLLFAWVLFALIAVPCFAVPSSSILQFSVARESFRRTAVVAGDNNYPVIATYNLANIGNVTGSISYLSVMVEGLTFAAFEINGNLYPMTKIQLPEGQVSRQWYASELGIFVTPGATMKIIIRGNVDPNADQASAMIDGAGGSWTSLLPPQFNPRPVPIIDEPIQQGFVNVSARMTILPDQFNGIGFVVTGDKYHNYPVLIRAVGPGLKKFGVTNALADPYLEVFDSAGNKLQGNDDWEGWLEGTFAQVGAFPLEAKSRDSAVLLWLAPGAYTVQVKGFGFSTGQQALVEAYGVRESYGK